MKTSLKLVLVSALIVSSGTLIAVPVNDTSNVSSDPQEMFEEPMYFGEDVKTVEKAYKILKKSVTALDNVMEDPENSIPPSLLIQSEGIVIFPSAFKLAVGVAGGQGARGVAMIRQDDGSWTNPLFVSLGEGSLGLQVGAQKSDIILLFKDKNDIMGIDETEMTLGSDIGVAAGPVSKGVSATSDIKFESEIYSYYRSRGLFAGISLKGGVLTSNTKINETLYCMDNVSAEEIFNEIETPFNERVSDLIDTLNKYGK